MKTTLIFLCITMSIISQEPKYMDGQIITRKGDTITAQIKVINRFKSFKKLSYLSAEGEEEKISIDSIKSYRRGNEIYETLIINSKLFVLAKRVIQGPNINLYYRDVYTGLVETGMPKILRNEYRYKYLKDKDNNLITLSYTRRAGETPLKGIMEKIHSKPHHKNKNLKKILSNYPKILEKIKNKELISIEDIVVECNNVNGKLWE